MRLANWREYVRSVALVIALALVVVLGLQGRSLRRELTRSRLQAQTPPLGFTVPAVRAATLRGDSVTIGRSPRGQVLFFFNTACGYCRNNLPAWQRIADRAQQVDHPVLGLTLDPDTAVRAYLARSGVSFEVVGLRDSSIPPLYRADVVPVTVVLDPVGRVVFSRAGVLSEAAVDSIVRAALGDWTRSE